MVFVCCKHGAFVLVLIYSFRPNTGYTNSMVDAFFDLRKASNW